VSAARFIARCVHGLEWLCADEISTAFPDVTGSGIDRREVTFTLPAIRPDVLRLATVDDVFVQAGCCAGVGTTKEAPALVARAFSRLPWAELSAQIEAVRPVPGAPLIDVVASLEGRRSYNRFAVECATGEVVAQALGGRYLARTAHGREPGEPDLTVRVFVRGDQAVAALRVSAVPAHRRAYKLNTAAGTLHPPVAAAMARLAVLPGEVTGAGVVLDPFCGDGTIPIEIALAVPGVRVLGSDADPDRLANARANAERAGVPVTWSQADAGVLTAGLAEHLAGPVGAIVTNPPWNLAVDAAGELARSLDAFWAQVPAVLAKDGRLVVLADADLDVPGTLRARGFSLGLVTGVRLAGRVCHLVLAAPAGTVPQLPPGAAAWRAGAIESGVLTSSGF
jgi:23S rRNA G2445 N2-methylase RlmL